MFQNKKNDLEFKLEKLRKKSSFDSRRGVTFSIFFGHEGGRVVDFMVYQALIYKKDFQLLNSVAGI